MTDNVVWLDPRHRPCPECGEVEWAELHDAHLQPTGRLVCKVCLDQVLATPQVETLISHAGDAHALRTRTPAMRIVGSAIAAGVLALLAVVTLASLLAGIALVASVIVELVVTLG